MAIVLAICPQCGAKIEVEDTHEAGICQECGTAFVTEKAVNRYAIYVASDNSTGSNGNAPVINIDNFIKMARNAINAGNGKEAVNYANKVLEVDPESSEAWLLKMRAIEYVGTIGNPRVTEAISYGDNAIKYAADPEKVMSEVYEYYIDRAIALVVIATSHLRDVAKIKQLASIGVSAMKGVANGDGEVRNLYIRLSMSALMLKLKVDEKYINEHEDMQNKLVLLAKAYLEMCEADVERLKIYGSKLLPEAITSRKTTLEAFMKGAPEEKLKEIDGKRVENNNEGNCYIATCVYGSYDCPQVWTLRRFRDYTLSGTCYGRTFIKCYYAISPTLVRWFGQTKLFRFFWKSCLDIMVRNLNNKGIDNTEYRDK
ncbi:MAG: hypothetical protein LUF68_05870 [Clostridiales bacterium]|nr:hypothetical protein [Clostridiales bacterium]MCD8117613.1 hypothetical protein [Oscillospiraceae bacterium]